MKITFILPAIGKKQGKKYIGTWKMEPLTIAVLKALTPDSIETELFDDRMELIDYNTKPTLCASRWKHTRQSEATGLPKSSVKGVFPL